MRYKKSFIFICLLVCLFSIASVVAVDVNETMRANENQNIDLIEIDDENNNIFTVEEQLDDVAATEEDELSATPGTFTDLAGQITGTELVLDKDYKYNSAKDSTYKNGITIKTRGFTIDGQGHSIDGSQLSRIFKVTSQDVTLKNIIFKNGYSSENGGAIYWTGTWGTIENCTFLNNAANKSGGAICSVVESVFFISNSRFDNNVAYRGGAVYSQNAASIYDSNFTNNRADYGGGLNLNCPNDSDYGTLRNTTFISNTASVSGGGAYVNGNHVSIYDYLIFDSNHAKYGGGIYISSAYKFIGADFYNNAATYGGAIYVNSINMLYYVDFHNNNVATYGDAIYFKSKYPNYYNSNYGYSDAHFTFNGEKTNYNRFLYIPNKYSSNLNVNVNNTIIFELLNVTIDFHESYDGIINVDIYNELNESVFNSQINLIGKGESINLLIPNLPRGNYVLNATYSGDNMYATKSFSSNFSVFGLPANLTFEPDCIDWGDEFVLAPYVVEGATGQIKVYVNGKYITTMPVGSTYTLNNLSGPYSNITLVYLGDNIYNSSTFTDSVFVSRIDPTRYFYTIESGITSNITLVLNEDATGNISVNFNGGNYQGKLVNGFFTFTTTYLKSGVKYISVNYEGDSKYESFNIINEPVIVILKSQDINLNIDNCLYGRNVVLTPLVSGSFGEFEIYVDGVYETTIDEGDSYTISKPSLGKHDVKVKYIDNVYYANKEYSTSFMVYKVYPIEFSEMPILYGSGDEFKVKFYDEYGNVLTYKYVIFNIDGDDYSARTDANGIAILPKHLGLGSYNITIINPVVSEKAYHNLLIFTSIQAENITIICNTDYEFKALFLDKNAEKLVNTPILFRFNNEEKVVTTDEEGMASLKLNLNIGIYDITSINTLTDEIKVNKIFVTTPDGKYTYDIPEKDINIPTFPSSPGSSVSIKLPSDATGTITLNIGGKNYNFNVVGGVANVKIPDLANGVYKYSITYSGNSKYSPFTKTGSVTIKKQTTPSKSVAKTTLTLKKVTLKRSAKKLVIRATLKVNSKAVKGKIIKFKFNKKTYKAKTNAKGVAKITVKKAVLKKLKKGKKVTYTATYGKVTKKVTVKVKK